MGLGFQYRVEVEIGCCLCKVMNLREGWGSMLPPIWRNSNFCCIAGNWSKPESSLGWGWEGAAMTNHRIKRTPNAFFFFLSFLVWKILIMYEKQREKYN